MTMTETETETTNAGDKLRRELAGFAGSETWHRHWSRRLIYTDGVRYVAEQARAYWLIDLVASHCQAPAIMSQDFIVWHLRVNDNRSAVAYATDGNEVELTRQSIPYTDFPLDQLDLYLTDNTLLLPSEY